MQPLWSLIVGVSGIIEGLGGLSRDWGLEFRVQEARGAM